MIATITKTTKLQGGKTMKNLKGKIFTMLLIGILFFCVSYLISKRFYINYEISSAYSYTHSVKNAIEELTK